MNATIVEQPVAKSPIRTVVPIWRRFAHCCCLPAREDVQDYVGMEGMLFDGEYKYTKAMVAQFFNVEERTIERYLETFHEELKHNGYILIRGKLLNELKLQFAPVINVGSKTTQLGLFNFRSVLNLAMILKESDNARLLRSKMLDIVLDTINNRTGGGTKFINRRDANYLPSAIQESNYPRFNVSVKKWVYGLLVLFQEIHVEVLP